MSGERAAGPSISAALRESETRQGFLLGLSDALRPLTDSVEIMRVAAERFGRHLGLSVVQYLLVEPDGDAFQMAASYSDGRIPNADAVHGHISDHGPDWGPQLRAGETIFSDDHDTRSSADAAASRAMSVRSGSAVPLLKDGRLVAILSTGHVEPRRWTESERILQREVAERTWAEVERARAEAALAASEQKYRNLFDSIDEGFMEIEVVMDGDRAVDWRYERLNPSFTRLTGLADVTGRLVSEFMPELEPEWADRFARVVRTGEGMRFELSAHALDRWFEVHLSRVGGAGSRKVIALYNNITERKRAEKLLRESEERQAFLLKLSDALRPLADPVTVQTTAADLLGSHLGAHNSNYYEIDADGWAIRSQGYVDSSAALPDRFPLTDLGQQWADSFDAGETIVISNVATDKRFSDAERDVWQANRLCATIGVPLVKDGRLRAAFGVNTAEPRHWTASEIALVEEVIERTWAAVERARAEAALSASEEKYRTLFHTMGQGYALLELSRDEAGNAVDMRYLELNPAAERLVGRAADVVGRLTSDVFPGTQPSWWERYDEVIRAGEPARFEHYFAPLKRWYEVNAYPAAGDRVAVLYDDITERKLATDALREGEDRQAFLLKLSDALRPLADPVAIMTVASETLGRHLGVGRCGYGEVDATGEFFIVARDWTDGEMATFRGRHRLLDFGPEFTAAYRAGRSVLIEDALADARAAGAEAAFEAAGGVRSSLGVPMIKEGRFVAGLFAQDVGPRRWSAEDEALAREVAERTWAAVERARAEAALRTSEERLQLALDVAELGTWEIDLATGSADLDARGAEIVGLPPGELPDVAAAQRAAVHPEDVDALQAAVATGIEALDAFDLAYRVVRPDGAVRHVASRARVVRDAAGRAVRLVGTNRDVTTEHETAAERERLLAYAEAARADAERANRAKSEFLAVMSHELRTPLNAIAGYAELMAMGIRGPVTGQQREDLARIQKSQQHLLSLINEVLNYARVESGVVRYDVSDVDIADVVASVEPLVRPQIDAKGLAYTISPAVTAGSAVVAHADREKLQQILLNLLSNAVKFTESGGRVIVDSPVRDGEPMPDGVVFLRVSDTGVGIPRDKQEAIFDPFVQVNPSLTRTTDGTGLGLAISRDLARGMGGDLRVRSEEGEGSTFTLALPAGGRSHAGGDGDERSGERSAATAT